MTDAAAPQPPLGLGLFTIRGPLAEDLRGTLAEVAEMGFEGVEPISVTGADGHMIDLLPGGAVPAAAPSEVRRVLDDVGLVAASMHAPLVTRENANALLDEAETPGTDLLGPSAPQVVHGFGPETFGSPDDVRRLADVLSSAAELAGERGARIGYHNHDFEVTQPSPERTALEELLELTDPRVFVEFDVTWVERAGVDPVPIVERIQDRVLVLHGRESLADAARVAPDTRWHIADLGTVEHSPMDVARRSYDMLTSERRASL